MSPVKENCSARRRPAMNPKDARVTAAARSRKSIGRWPNCESIQSPFKLSAVPPILECRDTYVTKRADIAAHQTPCTGRPERPHLRHDWRNRYQFTRLAWHDHPGRSQEQQTRPDVRWSGVHGTDRHERQRPQGAPPGRRQNPGGIRRARQQTPLPCSNGWKPSWSATMASSRGPRSNSPRTGGRRNTSRNSKPC